MTSTQVTEFDEMTFLTNTNKKRSSTYRTTQSSEAFKYTINEINKILEPENLNYFRNIMEYGYSSDTNLETIE